ncbi:MAG: hypothetical protein ABWW70_06645 [Thermoproteota archaeon]
MADLVLFRGYGLLSDYLGKVVREALNVLRDSGIFLEVTEVRVPILDGEDGFFPTLMLDGRELELAMVRANGEALANIILQSLNNEKILIDLLNLNLMSSVQQRHAIQADAY